MMSDLNPVAARGPSVAPGAATSAASSDAAPADGTFASLVNNAAAGGKGKASDIDPDADAQIDPHAVVANPDANGAQSAVAERLVFPELLLLGSAPACKSSSGAADRKDAAIDADEKSEDKDAESNEVPLEGILNINWLLTQPVSRLPRNLST